MHPLAFRIESCALGVGAGGVAWFSLYLVATGLLRGFGVDAPLTVASAAMVAAVGVTWWGVRPSLRDGIAHLVCTGLIGLLGIGLAVTWQDISYDGQAIHFPSALEIADGLNPAKTRPAMYFSAVYPNGFWTLQGLFISITSGFEEGKAPAWILALASIPLVTIALRSVRGAWSPGVCLAALLIQCNPVLLLQLTSFELDGVVYSLFVCAMAGAILLNTAHRRLGWVVVLGACVLLINTKITGLYWAGGVVAGVFVQEWRFRRRWPWKAGSALLLMLTVSLVVVGWRPYITVPLDTGKLFGATPDVAQGPENLRTAGALTRLSFLVLGKSSNPVGAELAERKWPWEFAQSEFVSLFDIRIGGFGPGFALQWLGALLVAAAGAWRMRGVDGMGGNALLLPFWTTVIATMAVLFPVSWWARLVGPFWLVAVLPLLWGRVVNLPPPVRLPSWARVARAVGWLLVAGGVLVTSVATFSTLRLVYTANQAIAVVLSDVASKGESVRIVPSNPVEHDGTHLIWLQRLIRVGIYPRVGDASGCQRPLFAAGSVQLCVDKNPL